MTVASRREDTIIAIAEQLIRATWKNDAGGYDAQAFERQADHAVEHAKLFDTHIWRQSMRQARLLFEVFWVRPDHFKEDGVV